MTVSSLSHHVDWDQGTDTFLRHQALALSQPSCRFRADLKLEDTYATAASFRKDGAWTVQTEPDSVPFQV
jgi:hypothetical protein